MPNASMVRWFCRVYSVLLYAYPRAFRHQYGGEMTQVFRDRCGYVARRQGRPRLFRFALHTAADWLSTIFQERIAALRELIVADYGRKAARLARAVWSAGRRPQPRGFAAEWVMTIVVYLFATTTLVQAYVIPTASMESGLRVGDHMLVDRVAYANPGSLGSRLLPYRDVQRGDLVAFLYPEDIRQTYVKRVVGIPGDRIRLLDKQVIRNGRRLIEPYTQHIRADADAYRDNFPTRPEFFTTPRGRAMFEQCVRDGQVTVPPGALFVMGDNRDNSSDSRYWGFVPREYVVGKPLLVYWSYDAPTADLEAWSVAHVLDVGRHFFTKTRWERTFLVPRSQSAQEVQSMNAAGGAQ
jgi:signal peptidase I